MAITLRHPSQSTTWNYKPLYQGWQKRHCVLLTTTSSCLLTSVVKSTQAEILCGPLFSQEVCLASHFSVALLVLCGYTGLISTSRAVFQREKCPNQTGFVAPKATEKLKAKLSAFSHTICLLYQVNVVLDLQFCATKITFWFHLNSTPGPRL